MCIRGTACPDTHGSISLSKTIPAIRVMVLCNVLAEHLHILLQEDSHPSPIVAVMVNKQQAPLLLRCYCCKALGIQSTDDAQTLPTSAGAVRLLESELKLTVQPLQICVCSLRMDAFLPHLSPSPPQPPSLVSPCSFSSTLSLSTL